MNVSPMVQAMIVYMRDHCPKTPKDLNFHAELKAASQWCWSDDYKQLVMKKVPVGDCRLKIAAKETLQTWEKKERDLETIKANKMGEDRDSSDESVDEQLSGTGLRTPDRLVAQLVECRAVMQEVVSSTPAGLTLRVLK